jgi:hypothetical protein
MARVRSAPQLEEPVLAGTNSVTHDADEPQERDTSERQQVQRKQHGIPLTPIREPVPGIGGVAGHGQANKHQRHREQHREDDPRHRGRPRRPDRLPRDRRRLRHGRSLSASRGTRATRGRTVSAILAAFDAVLIQVAVPTTSDVLTAARANGRGRNMLSALHVLTGSASPSGRVRLRSGRGGIDHVSARHPIVGPVAGHELLGMNQLDDPLVLFELVLTDGSRHLEHSDYPHTYGHDRVSE